MKRALRRAILFVLACALFAPHQVITLAAAGPVRLAWDPSATTLIEGYNVYRATGENGTFAGPINPTIIEDNWYIDNDPSLDPGGTYCYYTTTVGAEGQESAPSNEACIDRFSVSVRPDSAGAVFQSGGLVVVVADTGFTEGVAYSWVQLTGPAVSPVDLDKPGLVFPAPEVAEATVLEFRVDARYGQKQAQSAVQVTINP